MAFVPESIKQFRFVSYEFSEDNHTAYLNYAFDDQYHFTEEIIFNKVLSPLTEQQKKALDVCLSKLHLVAGSSYYKAAIPQEIIIVNNEISRETSEFMEKLYINGLGEFAYRNNLDLRKRIKFPFSENAEDLPADYSLPRKTIVPVGGGKDSVVTMTSLLNYEEKIDLFSVGNPRPIKEVVEVSGLNHIIVTRKLSPVLFELNKQGAWNGHVPISGIIAFIMSCASVIYGFDRIAMSNERSANVGNLIQDGFEINHQYSKGIEFEQGCYQITFITMF